MSFGNHNADNADHFAFCFPGLFRSIWILKQKKNDQYDKKNGKSKSKWVADLIREKTAGSWPENIINLAGAWSDMPTAEEIRKNIGHDAKRESI